MPTCTAIANTQTVELTAGTLTTDFCHETLQLTFDEFVSKTTGQLAGNMAAFTAGDDTPSGDDQDKLWFKQDGSGGADCVPIEGGWHWYNANAAPAAWEPVREDANTSPIGTIVMYAVSAAPTGWLLCNGGSFDSGTYSDLATLLGDTYETHSSTTYYLPDLRSRMPIGLGTGTGLTGRAIAIKGGSEVTNLSESQLPAHNHWGGYLGESGYQFTGNGILSRTSGFSGAVYGQAGSWRGAHGAGGPMQISTEDSTGTAADIDNIPPYVTLNFIIRAVA